MMAGKKPTHTLSVLHKETGKRGKIGVAWSDEDGSISIVLEAGVTISWKDDFIIKLFPKNADPDHWKKKAREDAVERQLAGAAEAGESAASEDDTPF
jgi:hypothetical protein